MRLRFLLIGLLLTGAMTPAQQATVPLPEPQYRDQYTVLSNGQLMALERESAITDTQSRRNFVIAPSTKVFLSIQHPTSPMRVPPGVHFFVKMAVSDRDPATLIHLRLLTATKKDRRVPYMTYQQSLIPFGGVKHERASDEGVAVTIQKYGNDSLEIIPTAPLPSGEYAFVNGYEAQCFGVDAGLAQPTGGAVQAAAAVSRPPAPPAVPTWRMLPQDRSNPQSEEHAAALTGMVESEGKRGPAGLTLTCSTTDQASSRLEVTLRVMSDMIGFMSKPGYGEFSCEGDGASGSPTVYTDIGQESLPARNACFDGQAPQSVAPVDLGLTYEEDVVQKIVSASGSMLQVHFRAQPGGPDDLVAKFPLPPQNAAVQQMVAPCIANLKAEHKKEQDSVVVACPVIDGQTLSGVDVLTGPAMKKLAVDPENDIGQAWSLPKVTRAHPVRPKLALACSYKGDASSTVRKKILLPIPAAATFCEAREDDYTNAQYGRCRRSM